MTNPYAGGYGAPGRRTWGTVPDQTDTGQAISSSADLTALAGLNPGDRVGPPRLRHLAA